eukprot:SAG25_NODE_4645_length_776_cov_0.864106_2_plen_129_part_00
MLRSLYRFFDTDTSAVAAVCAPVLSAAFEWFLDATQRTVEIVAPTGLDMAHAVVVAPLVEQPFEHVGAANVHINGLNITHTGAQYMYPYDNPSRGDWTIGRGGAVYFEDATNCSVTDCTTPAVPPIED